MGEHYMQMDKCEYWGNNDLQLFWPLVVAHKIDQRSPLYDLSPKDLQTRQFEVIISLEGTTPETGNTVQVFHQSFQFFHLMISV